MAKKKLNHSWKRVTGKDLDTGKKIRTQKNQDVMKDKQFIKKCKDLDIPITKRQASKYNNGYGMIFNYDNEILHYG